MLSLVLLFADCRCGSACHCHERGISHFAQLVGATALLAAGSCRTLLAWLTVIAMATLTDRTASATSAAPELLPFHSYRAVIAGENKEILRSNFMNVVLFYPAGLLTCELLPKAGAWQSVCYLLLRCSLW